MGGSSPASALSFLDVGVFSIHSNAENARPMHMVLKTSALPLHHANLLFIVSSLQHIIYKMNVMVSGEE